MKKQTLMIILALVLAIGAATAALATETDGSIIFGEGAVVIKPPTLPDGCGCCSECCDCGADCEVECICDCPCGCDCGYDYDNLFFKLDVDNDLYFGSHELTVYGLFDSANKPGSPIEGEERYTTEEGKFTGVEVINGSAVEAVIGVRISVFKDNKGVNTLDGAELTLMAEGAAALGGGMACIQGDEVLLSHEYSEIILTVDSGRAVKAAWYGLLDTEPGTAVPGKAQATMTWEELDIY